MTREEARNILESLSSDLWRELHPSQRDALDMAIEALQENDSLAKSVNEASELLHKNRPHEYFEELKELICELEEEKSEIDLNKVDVAQYSWFAGFKNGMGRVLFVLTNFVNKKEGE